MVKHHNGNIQRISYLMKINFGKGTNRKNKRIVKTYPSFGRSTKKKAWETIEEEDSRMTVSITGVDRILSHQHSLWLKLVWFVILVICVITCIYQIADTISNYIHGDPAVSIEFETNNSVKFPTLTFCPYHPFNYSKDILNSIEMVEYTNPNSTKKFEVWDILEMEENITLVWEKTQLPKENFNIMTLSCESFSGEDKCPHSINISYVDTVIGRCTSFQTTELVKYHGPATAIWQFLTNERGMILDELPPFRFVVYAHDDEDDFRYIDPFNGLFVKYGSGGLVSLVIKKKVLMNRSRNPCEEQIKVISCWTRCLDKLFEDATDCSLPFMINSAKQSCSTPSNFEKNYKAAYKDFMNFSVDQCPCPRKCNEYIYSIISDTADFSRYPISPIFFYFPTNIFMMIREYRALNLATLFANVCGSLGLYLGLCALSLQELILYGIKSMSKTIQKKFLT